MTLGDRIKLKRKELGLNVSNVAHQLGVSRATIYRYESSDIENMGVDKLAPLAKVLKTTPFYLLGVDHNDNVIPFNRGRMVPVLGRVPDGAPVLAEENVEDYTYADVPDDDIYFYLRVRGDGMKNAGIPNGALALIRRQDKADSGQIVACNIGGEDATLKRFCQKGAIVVLTSESFIYDTCVVPAIEFENGFARILGVVTEVRIQYDN